MVLTQAVSATFGCVELGLCQRGGEGLTGRKPWMEPVGGGCSLGVIYSNGRNLPSVLIYPFLIKAQKYIFEPVKLKHILFVYELNGYASLTCCIHLSKL